MLDSARSDVDERVTSTHRAVDVAAIGITAINGDVLGDCDEACSFSHGTIQDRDDSGCMFVFTFGYVFFF